LEFDGIGGKKPLKDTEAEADRILAELKLQEAEPPHAAPSPKTRKNA